MMKTLGILAVSLFFISCGKVNESAASGGGSGTGGGATTALNRGLIKHNGTTIARIVAWAEAGDIVNVYIPSVDRYATIDLYTGIYTCDALDSSCVLYFSGASCSGDAIAVNGTFVGQSGKRILYDVFSGKYYLVTGRPTTTNFGSSWYSEAGQTCQNISGTSSLWPVAIATQPYNFAAIAPLTVVFE